MLKRESEASVGSASPGSRGGALAMLLLIAAAANLISGLLTVVAYRGAMAQWREAVINGNGDVWASHFVVGTALVMVTAALLGGLAAAVWTGRAVRWLFAVVLAVSVIGGCLAGRIAGTDIAFLEWSSGSDEAALYSAFPSWYHAWQLALSWLYAAAVVATIVAAGARSLAPPHLVLHGPRVDCSGGRSATARTTLDDETDTPSRPAPS